ncbi:hypothetical protein QUD93_12940 [Lactococcus lactis]|nr:hypothetical protein [Lactococcus lactis]MDM7545365.1 hypothetical protein [Lactococcus lactis]
MDKRNFVLEVKIMYNDLVSGSFEYTEDNLSTIILGDSLEVMKNMKNNSVYLIFADEPYNIGKDFGNNIDKWGSSEEYIMWNKIWGTLK